jgi:hypothetical protein
MAWHGMAFPSYIDKVCSASKTAALPLLIGRPAISLATTLLLLGKVGSKGSLVPITDRRSIGALPYSTVR